MKQHTDTAHLERVAAVANAMAHPVRCRILAALEFYGSTGAAVRQLAEFIQEPDRKVRYHLQVLVEQGLAEVCCGRRRRNMVELFYRCATPPYLSADDKAAIGERQARRITIEMLKNIFGEAATAIDAGTFGASKGFALVRLVGEVDSDGWDTLGKLHEALLDGVRQIIDESEHRLATSRTHGQAVTSAFLYYEAPPLTTLASGSP